MLSLKHIPNWVVWNEEPVKGRLTKVPYNPNRPRQKARAGVPYTWGTQEKALALVESGAFQGIGFEVYPATTQILERYYENGHKHTYIRDLTEDEINAYKPHVTDHEGYSLIMIDLDDCIENDKPADWAIRIVEMIGSYWEKSPSGTGLHGLVLGNPLSQGSRKGKVEIYDSARYLTVTRKPLMGYNKGIIINPGGVEEVHREFVAKPESTKTYTSNYFVPKTVEAVIAKGMANATFGRKFTRLLNGNTTGYNPSVTDGPLASGYPASSEADLAFAFYLGLLTNNNATLIEEIFNESALARKKWLDRPDYRKKTIEAATGDPYDD